MDKCCFLVELHRQGSVPAAWAVGLFITQLFCLVNWLFPNYFFLNLFVILLLGVLFPQCFRSFSFRLCNISIFSQAEFNGHACLRYNPIKYTHTFIKLDYPVYLKTVLSGFSIVLSDCILRPGVLGGLPADCQGSTANRSHN